MAITNDTIKDMPQLNKTHRILALLLTFLLCSVSMLAAETLRVGWYPRPGIQNAKSNGRYSGYTYDYLRNVSQFTGWDYEFIEGSFSECVEKMKSHEIDLIAGVAYTPQRAEEYDFSMQSYSFDESLLITIRGEENVDLMEYSDMRIGVIRDSFQHKTAKEVLKRFGFDAVIVPYPDLFSLTSDLQKGNIGGGYISRNNRISIPYTTLLEYDAIPLYIITWKGAPFLTELNKAMKAISDISPDLETTLYDKNMGASPDYHLSLNAEEKAYISNHRKQKVAFESKWYPLEYYNEQGRPDGLMKKVLDHIELQTGFEFIYETRPSYKELNRIIQNGQVDIVASLGYDFDWGDAQNSFLTQPVIPLQYYRLYNDKADTGIVALPESYYLTTMIRRQERYMTIQLYDTEEACVKAVRQGKADATYINNYALSYFYGAAENRSLSFESLNIEQEISLGISKNADPLLYTIMTKAIKTIPLDLRNEWISKATTLDPPLTLQDFILGHTILFILSFVLLFLFISILVVLLFKAHLSRKQNMFLADANLVLNESNKAKSDFLSRMSHDIRTPLNGILGVTELMEESLKGKDLEDLEKIRTSADFLLGLVNDILDLAKVESGTIELHPEPYTENEFKTYLSAIFQSQCELKHINFILSSESQGRTIMLDRLRFNQIFFNLISNAIKFTPEGGEIRLFMKGELVDDGYLKLQCTLSDNGKGMSKEFQKSMFQSYSQERGNAQQGTGLGLAIAKTLVSLMHGTITVQSEKNKGTTFSLTFYAPLAKEKEKSTKAKIVEIEDQAFLKDTHVLVVDDHPLNREIAIRMLGKVGVNCITAENGRMAVESFKAAVPFFFDAILMDVRMPVLDGISATREIRAQERDDAKTIPIIAMTANAYESDQQSTKDAGMDYHLTKPLLSQTLYSTLATCIKKEKKKN